MPQWPPTARLLQATLKPQLVPQAHISARPAKTPTSPVEQAIALSAMFLSFLVPAGWVLSHLETYKKGSAR